MVTGPRVGGERTNRPRLQCPMSIRSRLHGRLSGDQPAFGHFAASPARTMLFRHPRREQFLGGCRNPSRFIRAHPLIHRPRDVTRSTRCRPFRISTPMSTGRGRPSATVPAANPSRFIRVRPCDSPSSRPSPPDSFAPPRRRGCRPPRLSAPRLPPPPPPPQPPNRPRIHLPSRSTPACASGDQCAKNSGA